MLKDKKPSIRITRLKKTRLLIVGVKYPKNDFLKKEYPLLSF